MNASKVSPRAGALVFHMLIWAMVSFALSGCLRFGLDVLKNTELKGSPYQIALVKEYLRFSQDEATVYDWVHAEHFSRKGLKVAEGQNIEPECLCDWEIPDTMLPSFEKARADLVAVITEDNQKNAPEALAKAVVSFDRWIEQQEEYWQADDIEKRRNEFFEALSKLSGVSEMSDLEKNIFEVAEETPVRSTSAKEEDAEEIIQEEPTLSEGRVDTSEQDSEEIMQEEVAEEATDRPKSEKHSADVPQSIVPSATHNEKPSNVIYFDSGKTSLNRGGMIIVNNIVTQIGDSDAYDIRLHGYADQVGKEEFRKSMAEGRANAVKKALLDKGLDAKKITAEGTGLIPSKKSKEDDPKNRRVDIFIKSAAEK